MSFALTTPQILARSKTVTRRIGWANLKPGTLLQAIEKGQGLKKGEKVRKLAVIRVKDVRRERLDVILSDREYGVAEVQREGFGNDPMLWHPGAFVGMFCGANNCQQWDEVNRIEFEYVDEAVA